MVRNNPVVDLARPIGIGAGGMGRRFDQAAHQVGIVIVVLALQQCTDPFQSHARVDGLHIERPHGAVLELFVLHEHKVPDFDEPVAILVSRARRTAPDLVTVVIENLGARAARTGRAHAPEIVIGGNADDPVVRDACDLLPDRGRLVIGMIDRDQQLVLVQAEIAGQQLPRKCDGLILEIIAETEIPKHFKERVMTGGITDIVQVVVLAPGTDTFLRRCRTVVVAGFNAGEQVLELHHAGIREHQCRIVSRHQRT